VLILLSTVFLFKEGVFAQTKYDSLKIKLPKHYFQTVILLDGYRKPEQEIKDTVELVGERLKTYGVKQSMFSLSTPIYTKEKYNKDSSVIKNTHVLLTVNHMSFRPQFSGLSEHDLTKSSIGTRIIYNPGKKGIWFIDISPFTTKDNSHPNSKSYFRMANSFIYSCNKSEKFNWRLGITKSFLWGNRFYLPFVGFRWGKLDKVNFSLQFPRNMSLNIPINDVLRFSVYTKPQGGMWNFSNYDSLYTLHNDAIFHFTRYEINTGFRLDLRIANWFSFYVATGFSTKNTITFYSDNANSKNKNLPYSKFFYSADLPTTLYGNFGIVFKFGKTRSYKNNRNIYDAIDLNNTIGAGDNNVTDGNTGIPIETNREKQDYKLKAVQDLIDYNDL
jgi:hypothetical protein